ncbi:hypothetical protein ACFL6S_32435 [Candidatus Poribacteria bacterium]
MRRLCALLFVGILVVSMMSFGLSAWAVDIKVLYFMDADPGGRMNPFRTVLNVTSAGGNTIVYTETDAIENEKGKLGDFDVVWLGFNSISDNGNNHIAGVEQALLDFTKAGGIVFSESPDDDGFQDAWLPSPISTLENAEHRDVEPTDAAGDLFESPNDVDLAQIQWDDNFANYDEAKYAVLAQKATQDRAEILMIENGKGLYIVSAIDTRVTSEDLEKLYENVFVFVLSAVAVEPVDKLPNTWGEMKSDIQ